MELLEKSQPVMPRSAPAEMVSKVGPIDDGVAADLESPAVTFTVRPMTGGGRILTKSQSIATQNSLAAIEAEAAMTLQARARASKCVERLEEYKECLDAEVCVQEASTRGRGWGGLRRDWLRVLDRAVRRHSNALPKPIRNRRSASRKRRAGWIDSQRMWKLGVSSPA